MTGAGRLAAFLDLVAVVPGPLILRGQPSPEGEMSAVPVTERRIRRRALTKEIESRSRSAVEAQAVRSLTA